MEPNRSSGILLDERRFSVSYTDKTKDCLCRVTFDLARKHHVLIDCLESLHELVSGSRVPFFRSEEPFHISLPGSAKRIQCYISGTFRQQIIGDDPSVYLTFWPVGDDAFIEYGSAGRLSKIGGGISNFKVCHLGADSTIRLDEGTWKFELVPVAEPEVYQNQIKNQSCAFTHQLLLQKSDARSFSWSQAQKALDMLSTFLSFCAEHWVAPALVKGYDQSGELAIQDWRTARTDSCEKRGNWLDQDHGGAMTEAFPGFAQLMRDEEWRETIKSAVYWYVRADTNQVGPDGSIILVQTALEKLAWHILVKVRRSISERAFSDLPAADQLRLVLDHCSVPLDLPAKLHELTTVAKGQKGEEDWIDGPHAFVAARNQIVHPGKRKRVKGGRAFYEALQLGKWYLELILLRSSGFGGSYACRLNIPMYAGSVEPVPWAQTKT